MFFVLFEKNKNKNKKYYQVLIILNVSQNFVYRSKLSFGSKCNPLGLQKKINFNFIRV